MPRQRIEDVIESALEVVDEGGVDDLPLAKVADADLLIAEVLPQAEQNSFSIVGAEVIE